MPDIRERFDVFDRLEPPDLWQEAQSREPHPSRGPSPRRSSAIVASIVSLVVSAAAISGLWYAFSRPGEQPNVPSAPAAVALVRVSNVSGKLSATLEVGSNVQRGQVVT